MYGIAFTFMCYDTVGRCSQVSTDFPALPQLFSASLSYLSRTAHIISLNKGQRDNAALTKEENMDINTILKKERGETPETRADRSICAQEVIFDGAAEQGVELDHVLPDYFPEIFRILKCTITPSISSESVSPEGKLTLDGAAAVKVLYLAEGSSAVYCIDQRYTFSKTVDLGRRGAEAHLTVTPRADYCNCRATSPRRIDVRGALTIRIKATAPVECVLPEMPQGMQVRTRQVTCCGRTLCAEKQLTVREEIDTGAAGIGFIIWSSAPVKVTDLRVIADKAVLKGVVTVSALYALRPADGGGCTETEKMTADIPVSAILDIDGITDRHAAFPELSVMSCELSPSENNGLISCELLIKCRVSAVMEQTAEIPTDAYSTEYESEFTCAPVKLSADPRSLSRQLTLRATLGAENGEMQTVWDCRSELSNLVCRPKDADTLTLSGQLMCRAAGRSAEGVPVFTEKQEAFEQEIPAARVSDSTAADFCAQITDTGFSIRSDGALDITVQAEVNGWLREQTSVDAINAVSLHEDKPKPRSDEYALRVYYTQGGEDCWTVAKRFNTTADAVMRENDVENEQAALSGMIFIPTM